MDIGNDTNREREVSIEPVVANDEDSAAETGDVVIGDITLSDSPVGLDPQELRTYDRLRLDVQKVAQSKIPPKYLRAVELLLFLPDFVVLIFRLLKDPRVPKKAKVKLALFTAYLASPIDIIPDFIPVFGQMDDLVGAVLVIRGILTSTPQSVVIENWSGSADVIKTMRMVIDVMGELLGKDILSAIAKMMRRKETGPQSEGRKA